MSSKPVNSPLELAVLGLVWQKPRSGYDLLKIFSESALRGFSSSAGAVYPALKRLKRGGCIAGKIENRDTLRPRRAYSLTAAGVETLKRCLRQPVTLDDVVRRAEEVFLRFAFAGEMLGRNEAIRVLREYARHIDAYLPVLRAQLAAIPRTSGDYGRYALQRGIDGYKADARWARRVIDRLSRQRSG